MIRLFINVGTYHNIESFSFISGDSMIPEQDEIIIYAWPDATLREIADMIKDCSEEAKLKTAKLGIRMIYPDEQGKAVPLDLGILSNTTRGYIDNLTLSSIKYQTGDYFSVALYT